MMTEKIKELLIQKISYLSLYEIAILLGIFLVFIMFFILGLLLRGRRFIAAFFFFFSILVIFSTPFVLHLVMKYVLYKIEVNIANTHVMQYTKGFFVSGEIIHKGKIPFNECYISVNEVHDEKESKLLNIINTIMPISSSGTMFDMKLEVGGKQNFAVIVPHFEAKEPFSYRIYVDCYLSNKFAQKLQAKAQKSNVDIIRPTFPQALSSQEENKQSNDSKQTLQEQ